MGFLSHRRCQLAPSPTARQRGTGTRDGPARQHRRRVQQDLGTEVLGPEKGGGSTQPDTQAGAEGPAVPECPDRAGLRPPEADQLNGEVPDLLFATLDAISRFRVGQREAVGAALEAGGLLTEAKGRLQHGEWGDWLHRVGLAPRTAARATFALNSAEWLRRGRLLISRSCLREHYHALNQAAIPLIPLFRFPEPLLLNRRPDGATTMCLVCGCVAHSLADTAPVATYASFGVHVLLKCDCP